MTSCNKPIICRSGRSGGDSFLEMGEMVRSWIVQCSKLHCSPPALEEPWHTPGPRGPEAVLRSWWGSGELDRFLSCSAETSLVDAKA